MPSAVCNHFSFRGALNSLIVGFVFLLLTGSMTMPLRAADPVVVQYKATEEKGFARIILNFEHLPAYENTVKDTVMVFKFSEAINLDFSQLVEKLPSYIGVARVDPDGRAFRMAFTDSYKVNVMEAGKKIFVDILGRNWSGMPPNLPQDVVREITRRAAEIEAKNRETERQRKTTKFLYKARLRVGVLPTFSRLVFDWNKFVTAKMERQGDVVTLTFGRPVGLDVGRVKHDLPKFLKDIESKTLSESTSVKITVAPKANVKGYREGEDYVVDISSDDVALSEQLKKLEKVTLDEDGNPVDRAAIDLMADAEQKAPMTEFSGAKDEVNLVRSTYSSFNPDEYELEIFADNHEQAGIPNIRIDQQPVGQMGVPGGLKMQPAGVDGKRFVGGVKLEARPYIKTSSSGTEIGFPFKAVVPAAGFIRGDTIWIVFDSFDEIDLSGITDAGAGLIRGIRKLRLNNGQLILIKLAEPMLFAFTHERLTWIARVGDMVTAEAQSLKLQRRISPEKKKYFSVDLARPGHVYWLKDEEIGDQIGIVSSYPPVEQLSKPQEFVEFSSFGTAHGVAVSPKVDDLEIRVGFQEVVISRHGGLHLSDDVELPQRAEIKRDASVTDVGFIDFNSWRRGGNGAFMDQMGAFESRIALAEEDAKFAARRDYARFLIANELALETLGLLKRTLSESPERHSDPELRMIEAAANVMMRRPEDAIKALSIGGLYNNEHASLWRGLAKLMMEQWSDALRQFRNGETAIAAYPDLQKAQFHLGAARAALGLKNYETMANYLDMVPDTLGQTELEMSRRLLHAQYLMDNKQDEEARALFDVVAASDVSPLAAKAKIYQLKLQMKSQDISRTKAISELEGLQMIWRGDSTELEMLSMLSDLYASEGQYRLAFANMKQAVKAFPAEDAAMRIQDNMAKEFKRLFLQNKVTTMRPIEALSLFYDFKELTPIGRAGDEMIRMLADRLIDVDLLDHAAELLEHQVNNRVRGAARSQVAAKLAMVHLMNRKPQLALQAIGRTRQPDLPWQVKRARDILEARSLSEIGQVDGAVDILNRLAGPEVERMKADAYWNAQQWGKAGEQLEKLMGTSWNSGQPLEPFQRQDVLRAAISYSLSQDAFALSRLRKKFYNKMVNSPDATPFIVVTKPVQKDGSAYKRLAKEIASINTLDAFMKQYRDHYNSSLGADEFLSGPSEPEGAL